MQLVFDPNLDFQMRAVHSVCDLFTGQDSCQSAFTVTTASSSLGIVEADMGVGNRLTLSTDDLLGNLNDVQIRNGLAPSEKLESNDFTIEMETGTGKTYVYLRTIFELHKRYDFTKFVIVVPSIAIKEGVYKTLQITHNHLRSLYSGVSFDYFLYDSARLGQIRGFATSPQIQIMIVTVGSINKQDVNNLYKDTEGLSGDKPIDYIRATRPILIVDEPQSVDGGLRGRGKDALDKMYPLCTLRYSATHVDKHQMVYRLNAVDAYERKLVKQIEVASATVEDSHNRPYVSFVAIKRLMGTVAADIELDVESSGRVKRRQVSVCDGDDLAQISKREIYRDCRIGEIRATSGQESLELRMPDAEVILRIGEAYGDVDLVSVHRQLIRRTIREHFSKELFLRPQGIKVLSLFFVDAVDKYRQYSKDGTPVKGPYASIFEEEYRRLAKHPDFSTLFNHEEPAVGAEDVHDGYFSIDRHGTWKDTSEQNQANRSNAERAYNLIMRDKERLLDFGIPLRFIFSHSALREGWDNPNVFQICTLRDIKSELQRRQTIGRGLRLCVNQDGLRQRDSAVNTLTVIATESYEKFADQLQHEIEENTGIQFGYVASGQFVSVFLALDSAQGQAHHSVPHDESDTSVARAVKCSEAIWKYLHQNGDIATDGKIQDSLRRALREGSFEVPDEFSYAKKEIEVALRKLTGRIQIRNADERRVVRPRQCVLDGPEFRRLWDKIKHKTTYRVQFDPERLREMCISALRESPRIPKSRLHWRVANLVLSDSGVEPQPAVGTDTVSLDEGAIELPDILTELQDRTRLTRKSIVGILFGSSRLDDFRRNPQKFIEVAAQVINRCKQRALVDGVKYERLGNEHYYSQQLFRERELTGYLRSMLATKKSVYDHVVYESQIEAAFAEDLEKSTRVKVYAKLPWWFTIPTPLGTYNPDWAVLVDSGFGERLYFVVETKSSLLASDLRSIEDGKIRCGDAHFRALRIDRHSARYIVATDLSELLSYDDLD